jgi:hypothetical protein
MTCRTLGCEPKPCAQEDLSDLASLGLWEVPLAASGVTPSVAFRPLERLASEVLLAASGVTPSVAFRPLERLASEVPLAAPLAPSVAFRPTARLACEVLLEASDEVLLETSGAATYLRTHAQKARAQVG